MEEFKVDIDAGGVTPAATAADLLTKKDVRKNIIEGDRKPKVKRVMDPDPTKPRCQHWLIDKKRYCRLNALKESNLCAEHVPKIHPTLVMPDGRVRIPCPYNNRHTCFQNLVEQHMRKCNDRPKSTPAYVDIDVNIWDNPETRARMKLNHPGMSFRDYDYTYSSDLTDAEYSDIIRDIISLHQRDVPDMRTRYGVHPIVGRELVRSDIGTSAAKHLAQIGSILKIMEDDGLFQDGTCYVEYGSGRGTLSYHVALAILEKRLKNCSLVLVDLTSPRHKQDNRLKDSGLEIHRVRADIKDLVVAELPGVKSNSTKFVVGLAKHLCGNAADLAIHSLFDLSNEALIKVAGAVIATCCHHRCNKDSYVGMSFVKRKFPPGNFPILTQIAAWGTDGDAEASFDQTRAIKQEHRRFYAHLKEFVPQLYLRKTIGDFVKHCIDFGRVKFIESIGDGKFSAETVKFVDALTTLENTAIVVSVSKLCHQERKDEERVQLAQRIKSIKQVLNSAGEPAEGLGRLY